MVYDRIYIHQKNPLFVMFVYVFVTFGECIKIPLGVIRTLTLYDMIKVERKGFKRIGMIIHLTLYISLIVIFPFRLTSPSNAFICSATHMATSGLLFG